MGAERKSVWWLSFADEAGCRGICIVDLEVELPDHDDEFILAVRRSHQRKINLGGQVKGTKIHPDDWHHVEGHINKSFTKEEAAVLFGAKTEEEHAAEGVDSKDGN